MPNVRNVDRSAVDNALGWVPPPSLPMCEPTQVHNRGTSSGTKEGWMETRRQTNAARSEGPVHWPFLYSYKGDTVIINTGPTKTQYETAAEVGVATF